MKVSECRECPYSKVARFYVGRGQKPLMCTLMGKRCACVKRCFMRKTVKVKTEEAGK